MLVAAATAVDGSHLYHKPTPTKAGQMQEDTRSSAISLQLPDRMKKVSKIGQLLPQISLLDGAHLSLHLQFGKLGGKILSTVA